MPALLDDLIMKCVEIPPENRPGSMREVADRLELILGKLRAERQLRQTPAPPVVDDDEG